MVVFRPRTDVRGGSEEVRPDEKRIFVTFFSPWASYTKTVARSMTAIVTEWLAVLKLGKAGTAGLSSFLAQARLYTLPNSVTFRIVPVSARTSLSVLQPVKTARTYVSLRAVRAILA